MLLSLLIPAGVFGKSILIQLLNRKRRTLAMVILKLFLITAIALAVFAQNPKATATDDKMETLIQKIKADKKFLVAKTARFIQMQNRIRAELNAEIARQIPLVY